MTWSVSVSLSGRRVAAGSGDSSARVWELEADHEESEFGGEGRESPLAIRHPMHHQ
eukprot:CAMPEP_0196573326 /NCGR_PEP_ID=MMETSP1081-20130531/3242_1 /TAXON_ID=36882 /ORGANISM="Pyramimonas amylifera, Strain CCMP720" /LENGTH=55 /DNA_ID=CAMNT_0041890989 /DNA_START=725 /DNA_END=892 /DNA_ORIENTATION=-